MTALSANIDDVRAAFRFLAHAGRGVTEVRVIRPGRGIVGIGFFDDEDAFVRTCVEHAGRANVYAGIQPRPARFLELAPNRIARLSHGAGDDDIEWLTAVVVDLDPVRPKDEASSNAELVLAVARAEAVSAWLEGKGFRAPVRVMSGNGCHLWFAVPPHQIAGERREELTRRLKTFEGRLRDRFSDGAVRIDSIYNLSRIIKVVGTPSVKGGGTAERPHRVSQSLMAFERAEDGRLLDAILSMPLPPANAEAPAPGPGSSVSIRPGLGDRVAGLLLSNVRLAALFHGRSKNPVGPDGRSRDTSSSGYDFSLLLALARKGVTDPDELASALWNRPDGGACTKGEEYIARTVRRALATASSGDAEGGAARGRRANDDDVYSLPEEDIDFAVTKLVVSDSDPPLYQLHVDDHVLVLTVDDLLSPRRFEKRFVAQLRRIPRLPGKKAKRSWDEYVNEWLAAAEVIHQPPEASPRGLLREETARVIDNLGEADTPADLERGKVLRIDGRRGFKTRTVLRALRETVGGDAGTHEVCSILRELGCESALCRLDGMRVRLWLAPPSWTDPASPEADADTDQQHGEGQPEADTDTGERLVEEEPATEGRR